MTKAKGVLMSRRSLVGLTLLVGIAMSCDVDKPTEPVNDLVGSWTYRGTDFGSTAAANLQNYLLDLGWNLTAAQRMVAGFRNEMEAGFRDTGLSTVRFNADRTYEDNAGTTGVWSVQGDVLTMVAEDGFTIQCQYSVDGDDLTLVLNKERYLNLIRQSGGSVEVDPEIQALLDILFGDENTLRLFYKAS